MRSLTILTIALVAFSGTALAATDSPDDPYGATPYCDADQWRSAFWTNVNNAPGIDACEGEHWEGADPGSGCTPINGGSGGNGFVTRRAGPGDVGGCVRAGSDAFVAVDIGGVGGAHTFASSDTVAVYLRDDSDQLGVTCIAFAAQDCNALAEVVHASPIRSGSGVREEGATVADCRQQGGGNVQSYEEGSCNRDNTAITIYKQ